MRLVNADKFIEDVERDREHEIYLHSWTADDVLKRLDSWYAPTVNAIPIPKHVTNGEMLLALFPDTEYYQHNGIINTDIDDGTLFDEDWWEAPYKRGNADE